MENAPEEASGKQQDTFLGGLTPWTPRAEVYEEYLCESCLKYSRYTRMYSLTFCCFGLVFIYWWSRNYFRCPAYMRQKMAWLILPAILLANILSPFMLISWLNNLRKTYSRLPFDDGR